MARVCPNRDTFRFQICLLSMVFCVVIAASARSDQDIRERFYGNLSLNSSSPNTGEGSIAKIFDEVLEKEFSENDQPEGNAMPSLSLDSGLQRVEVCKNPINLFKPLDLIRLDVLRADPQAVRSVNGWGVTVWYLELGLAIFSKESPRIPPRAKSSISKTQVSVSHKCMCAGGNNVGIRILEEDSPPQAASFQEPSLQGIGTLLEPNDEYGLEVRVRGSDGSSFNSSVADQQAELETVAKITHEKGKKNESQAANGTRSFQFNDVFSLENEGSDDMTTLIDKKDNVFVMSNKKSKYPVLQVDLRLISDLVVVIVSAAIGGIIFSCIGQPVETVAQFGVVFLLFALGLEFSLTKLKVVGPVAVLGGLLQIAIFMFLCGITATLCGAKLSEGIFVGCFLSMSSTAVVVKFLVERNSNNALHGQVTIGTLIFQDCAVGLLFALLPVLGGNSGILQGMMSMGKLLLVLSIYISPWHLLKTMNEMDCGILSLKMHTIPYPKTNELYQLAAVAFCLLSAWCSDKLGLSLELGSFVAGVMISTTDFAQHTLDQVEPIRNLFAALFLSSIGMLIHVQFLWTHVDILLASVILVVVVKTTFAAIVTKVFGYSAKTSFLIGEFAFVLLSRASNLHLVEGKMYLLLLGTTALSLVTTPVLFKLMPAMMHLGVLMHWFPSESGNQNEDVPREAEALWLVATHRSALLDAPHLGLLEH
ncbi:K+ efflux antiporter 5 [Actinidia rufa]|uniref:K+ efflux antiporter 5 n=1 Tax=Actinidia rufa TaxID=165716 RepID=A0A7J0EAP6_9ERIC|nr:K+ efflux antiporter 5 [Actinidia rufa]